MNSIFKRRSIRKYKDKRVAEEDIQEILRAGMAAPSAGNQQPWRFIVVDDREILNKIPEVHPYSKMLKEASHAIVVCGDVSVEKHKGYWVQDCAAATQNMLLMATELCLGTVWLGVHPNEERVAPIKDLFDIPEQVIPLSIIAVGYPAETKGSEDRFDKSKIYRNKWQ